MAVFMRCRLERKRLTFAVSGVGKVCLLVSESPTLTLTLILIGLGSRAEGIIAASTLCSSAVNN